MFRHPKTLAKLSFLFCSLFLAGVLLLLFGIDSGVNRENLALLRSYGWQVEEKPTEISHFTIPLAQNPVVEALQAVTQKDGFDLSSHKGKHTTRYTYRVLNHADSKDGTVYLYVFVTKDGIIAAVLGSPSPDGFLLPVSDISGQVQE
ncbi:MAG: DUF4830 domain-containing protein [Clostridia bacterium]|nr:DUF4830 domain-containing protein [Clostridia bacterium]